MRRVISGAVVALLVAAGAAACRTDQDAQYGTTRTTESPGSETGTTSIDDGDVGVFSLKVGDCVGTIPSEAETIVASFDRVPCDRPHDAQVYAAFDVTFEEFPGDAAMDDAAFDGCMDRVPASIEGQWGVDGLYGPYMLQPTRETWELDDREVMCMVVRIDEGTITGDLL